MEYSSFDRSTRGSSLREDDEDVGQPYVRDNLSASPPTFASNVTSLFRLGGHPAPSELNTLMTLADGLAEQIALLDRDWTILAINRPWRDASRPGTAAGLFRGTNYLQYCDTQAREGCDDARAISAALRSVDAGEISSFDRVDASEASRTGRVYEIRVYRCEIPGRNWYVLARYDVTRLNALMRQKRRLASKLIGAEAEERRRLARDLHDSTAQDLVALQLSLARLKRGFRTASRARFADVDETLERLQREIRSLSYLLHPPEVEHGELSNAIGTMARGFGQRTGLDMKLFLDDIAIEDPQPRAALYRLTQEALTNIHRHAQASEVEVRLIATDTRIHMMIKDNGKGVPSGELARVRAGVGLASMRHRIEELGGCFAVRSGGVGTSVVASLPISSD